MGYVLKARGQGSTTSPPETQTARDRNPAPSTTASGCFREEGGRTGEKRVPRSFRTTLAAPAYGHLTDRLQSNPQDGRPGRDAALCLRRRCCDVLAFARARSATTGDFPMLRSILTAAGAASLLVALRPMPRPRRRPARRRRPAGRERQCRLADLQCRRRHRLRVRLVQGPELPVHPDRRHRRALYRHHQASTASISASPRKRRWSGWSSRRATSVRARLPATMSEERRRPPSAWAPAPMFCWAAAAARSPCSRSASRAASA